MDKSTVSNDAICQIKFVFCSYYKYCLYNTMHNIRTRNSIHGYEYHFFFLPCDSSRIPSSDIREQCTEDLCLRLHAEVEDYATPKVGAKTINAEDNQCQYSFRLSGLTISVGTFKKPKNLRRKLRLKISNC